MFQGSIVALLTPLNSAGELDEKRLIKLIEMHLAEGTQGFVLNGTTGEAPTLTEKERERTLKIGIELAKNKVPIIMGTGTNSTIETIRQTKKAEEWGADACLIVTPYYNKPTQEGLYQHFEMVAKSTQLPIILYNVPTRTACDLLPETVGKLSTLDNIVGIKEASGEVARCQRILQLCDKSFDLLTGCDDSALAFMLQGGHGVISVTANIAPKLMRDMCQAAKNRDVQKAGSINSKLMPLHKNLFLEANPIPVKWAAYEMGWIEDNIRLPLTRLSKANQEVLKAAMKESGVLSE